MSFQFDPSMIYIENGIFSDILSLQGRTKIRYIKDNGRYLLEVNFSNVNISLT